jgi:hypothetical protein
MKDPILQESALSLIEGMRSGRTTAVAVMRAALQRIKALEPDVRAFAHFDAAAALALAERADKERASGDPPGSLHGLPVAVKDIIDTADFPTEYGGEIFLGRQPERDATIVKRLRAAGAIVIGKTITSQYALFVPGPTRNPRDLTRTPGGSSSGSAAAVAAGFVPVALGTQTNGSVIRPIQVSLQRVSLMPRSSSTPSPARTLKTHSRATCPVHCSTLRSTAIKHPVWRSPSVPSNRAPSLRLMRRSAASSCTCLCGSMQSSLARNSPQRRRPCARSCAQASPSR